MKSKDFLPPTRLVAGLHTESLCKDTVQILVGMPRATTVLLFGSNFLHTFCSRLIRPRDAKFGINWTYRGIVWFNKAPVIGVIPPPPKNVYGDTSLGIIAHPSTGRANVQPNVQEQMFNQMFKSKCSIRCGFCQSRNDGMALFPAVETSLTANSDK